MTAKDGNNEFLINLFVRLIGVLYLCLMVFASLDGLRQFFIVSSPLLVVFVPGYLEAVHVTHGTTCDCFERDSRCEILFWYQLAGKFLLVVPLLWMSIFFYYAIEVGIAGAVDSMIGAIMLTGIFFAAYFFLINAVVAVRKP